MLRLHDSGFSNACVCFVNHFLWKHLILLFYFKAIFELYKSEIGLIKDLGMIKSVSVGGLLQMSFISTFLSIRFNVFCSLLVDKPWIVTQFSTFELLILGLSRFFEEAGSAH